MRRKNQKAAPAAIKLLAMAEQCFQRAETLHRAAEDAAAAKLIVLGEKLEADAVAINGEQEMGAGRTSPSYRENDVDWATSTIAVA